MWILMIRLGTADILGPEVRLYDFGFRSQVECEDAGRVWSRNWVGSKTEITCKYVSPPQVDK